MATVGDNTSTSGTNPAISLQLQGQQPVSQANTGASGPPPKVHRVVVVRFTMKYVKSIPGVLTVFQMIFVMLALIFLTTATPTYGGYLLLPLDWHLRVFVFTTVSALLFSVASYIINVYRITESLRIPWKKFNFISNAILCFFLLFGSSMVASTIGYYANLYDGNIPSATKRHLVIAAILGYISMLLYGACAYFYGRQLRGFFDQFDPQRFASQGSTSQPTTPSTETGPGIVQCV